MRAPRHRTPLALALVLALLGAGLTLLPAPTASAAGPLAAPGDAPSAWSLLAGQLLGWLGLGAPGTPAAIAAPSGHGMDPDGSPSGQSGHGMDPNGSPTGQSGGHMDPNG